MFSEMIAPNGAVVVLPAPNDQWVFVGGDAPPAEAPVNAVWMPSPQGFAAGGVTAVVGGHLLQGNTVTITLQGQPSVAFVSEQIPPDPSLDPSDVALFNIHEFKRLITPAMNHIRQHIPPSVFVALEKSLPYGTMTALVQAANKLFHDTYGIDQESVLFLPIPYMQLENYFRDTEFKKVAFMEVPGDGDNLPPISVFWLLMDFLIWTGRLYPVGSESPNGAVGFFFLDVPISWERKLDHENDVFGLTRITNLFTPPDADIEQLREDLMTLVIGSSACHVRALTDQVYRAGNLQVELQKEIKELKSRPIDGTISYSPYAWSY